jgi:prepilin-type N-terminal cleavage/methylation domain-containing protein
MPVDLARLVVWPVVGVILECHGSSGRSKRSNMMKRNMKFLSQRGFSLLEVVIAIAIFAIGMLALASMQGSLTRSSADANLRTVAANIAERTIEDLRGFGRIDLDPNPDPTLRIPAYAGIVDTASEEVWAAENSTVGISFFRTIEVEDYYYVIVDDNFSTTPPTGMVVPDFKMVEVNVSWGGALEDNAGFQLDESQDALSSSDLGSGEITLSTMISSITTQGSARVSAQGDGSEWEPFVSYSPGARPDIIPVSLGGDIYKESLLPEPDVTRDDELIETRFEVITYSQPSGEIAQFVRREEFAVVSCDCTLAGEGAGRRPVIWAGDEYVRGQFVQKIIGVSANNQQSSLCDTCCRDHHDGGSSTEDHESDSSVNVYDPFNKPDASDHEHYDRTNNGLAAATGDYVEACRLVRQDGFFRVAQDFRREDLNIFPDDFFSGNNGFDEVQTYSEYVAGAVTAYVNVVVTNYPYYPSDTPCIGPSGCAAVAPKQSNWDATLEANELPSWTFLSNALGIGIGVDASTQQLRSRGVYMDYVSADLRTVLTNCTGSNTADDEACKEGDVELDRTGHVNPLELVPFFDVQMTKLNRWNEAPANIPVEATNEPLENNNTHSRGFISKVSDGGSTVVSTGHRGNLGFTDSFPIDTLYFSLVTSSDIFVDAGSGSSAGGTAILGGLSHTLNGNPDIMVTGSEGVECGQTTVDYGCTVLSGATNPQIIISGYGKNGRIRYACSIGTPLVPDSSGTITDGEFAEAAFNLTDVPAGTTYNFIVQEGVPCS